jgi:hypothetical protein
MTWVAGGIAGAAFSLWTMLASLQQGRLVLALGSVGIQVDTHEVVPVVLIVLHWKADLCPGISGRCPLSRG